jgi:pimeloyl-ACP methyl ester carboxylesterase
VWKVQSAAAKAVNGENGRFDDGAHPAILPNIELGTAGGVKTRIMDVVELKHPLGSPYNFYTWSELVTDVCRDVVLKDDTAHSSATLVCNSIGTMTALQAVLDTPEHYKGVFCISPNFRELHSAEVAFPMLTCQCFAKHKASLNQIMYKHRCCQGFIIRIGPHRRETVVVDLFTSQADGPKGQR